MTLITWTCLRYVQEMATILGPQNRTQGSCVMLFVQKLGRTRWVRQLMDWNVRNQQSVSTVQPLSSPWWRRWCCRAPRSRSGRSPWSPHRTPAGAGSGTGDRWSADNSQNAMINYALISNDVLIIYSMRFYKCLSQIKYILLCIHNVNQCSFILNAKKL